MESQSMINTCILGDNEEKINNYNTNPTSQSDTDNEKNQPDSTVFYPDYMECNQSKCFHNIDFDINKYVYIIIVNGYSKFFCIDEDTARNKLWEITRILSSDDHEYLVDRIQLNKNSMKIETISKYFIVHIHTVLYTIQYIRVQIVEKSLLDGLISPPNIAENIDYDTEFGTVYCGCYKHEQINCIRDIGFVNDEYIYVVTLNGQPKFCCIDEVSVNLKLWEITRNILLSEHEYSIDYIQTSKNVIKIEGIPKFSITSVRRITLYVIRYDRVNLAVDQNILDSFPDDL